MDTFILPSTGVTYQRSPDPDGDCVGCAFTRLGSECEERLNIGIQCNPINRTDSKWVVADPEIQAIHAIIAKHTSNGLR